ncbi:rab-GTPase-TBC domain-containing protein [Parasitella parasitica]|nr:rab-GTPase-TBC domain-containing protein [Parasitella parasitica]
MIQTDTNVHSNPPPTVWLDLSNAIQQAENENPVPRQDSSQLTTCSSETDFTQVTTSNSSIRTAPARKSISELSFQNRRDSDLRRQYEQRPEKVPDVAAQMEKWYAMTDRYGFLEEQPSKSELKVKAKEVERAEKWANMSTAVTVDQENAYKFVYDFKFKKRVYKGIPDCWRREAWYYLATERLENATKDPKLRATYQELLLKENTHERQIDLDIPRTLRDHIMFRQRYGSGQRALFNVLRAFASYDEEVGYCQGMTNIVATILMYCEEEVKQVYVSWPRFHCY